MISNYELTFRLLYQFFIKPHWNKYIHINTYICHHSKTNSTTFTPQFYIIHFPIDFDLSDCANVWSFQATSNREKMKSINCIVLQYDKTHRNTWVPCACVIEYIVTLLSVVVADYTHTYKLGVARRGWQGGRWQRRQPIRRIIATWYPLLHHLLNIATC